MLFLRTAKRKAQSSLFFKKRLWSNEKGWIYPHLLLALVLASAVSLAAASSAVSQMHTAEFLTEYYEIRIIELMALRHFIKQPDAAGFSFRTNKGTTAVTISEVSGAQLRIQVKTALPERSFFASFYYDKEMNLITARREHQ